MDIKTFGGGVVLGAILAGLVFVAVQSQENRHVSNGGIPAVSDSQTLEGAAENTALQQENRRLQEELQRSQQQNQTLENQIARQKVESSPPEPLEVAEQVPEKVEALEARFAFGDYRDAIESIDWEVTGEALKHMIPLIEQLAENFSQEGDVDFQKLDPELLGKIQRWNGELVTQAMKAMQAKIPGFGVNGSFTHPMMAANQINALFEKSRMPLSEAQQQSVESLTSRYTHEYENLRNSYGEDAFALQKILDEADLKDRFYGEASNVYNPDQYKLMYGEKIRGRMSLDIFSSGIIWSTVGVQPLEVKDRQDYGNKLYDQMSKNLSLDATNQARLKAVIDRWSGDYPENLIQAPLDNLGRNGMLKTDRIRLAAQKRLELMREVMANLDLNEAEKKKLRGGASFQVPYIKK